MHRKNYLTQFADHSKDNFKINFKKYIKRVGNNWADLDDFNYETKETDWSQFPKQYGKKEGTKHSV